MDIAVGEMLKGQEMWGHLQLGDGGTRRVVDDGVPGHGNRGSGIDDRGLVAESSRRRPGDLDDGEEQHPDEDQCQDG